MSLFKEHLEDLQKSGLNEETIKQLGFYSIEHEKLKEELAFSLPEGKTFTAMVIPYQDNFKRYKIFPPVTYKEDDVKKYLQAKNSGIHVYLPEGYRKRFIASKVRYITEGEKKGAKANQEGYPTLALGGIWNWKTKESLQPIPELHKIDWILKDAVLIPDSDFRYKQGVLLAVYRLGKELEKLGANVSILVLPVPEQGDKAGLDDFLIAGGKIEDLETIGLKHPIFKANACKEGKEKKKQERKEVVSEKINGLAIREGDSAQAIQILKNLGYKFQYNEVKNILEYSVQGSEWKRLKMRDYNNIFLFVRQHGTISNETFGKLLNSEYVSKTFDPFKEFFESTKWDGEDRLDELFKTLNIKTDEDLPFQFVYLKKWLISAVGCMLGEIPNETCLVLNGPQGHYKTKWFKALFENNSLFKDYQVTTKSLDSGKADSMRLLVENGLIILDELEALNKAEVEDIKLIFSKTEISVRLPYDRDFSNLPRHASFCGTTNNPIILKDATGSRRWLIITIDTPIDYDALQKKINYPQIWAQAYSLYKSGEKYWFDAQETKALNEENEKYYFAPIADELLDNCQCLDEFHYDSSEYWKTATELANLLLDGKPVTDKFVQQMGHALRKKGYVNKQIKGIRKWNVELKQKRNII